MWVGTTFSNEAVRSFVCVSQIRGETGGGRERALLIDITSEISLIERFR